MKKKSIFIILCIIIILFIAIIFSNFKNNNNLITKINIEEGCYESNKDSEHLICITKDHKFYSVLHKYGRYYNDVNYYIPPKDDTSYGKYKFKFDYDKNSFYIKETSKDSSFTLKCNTENSTTFKCVGTTKIDGNTQNESAKYTKVDKEFNKKIINELSMFNRTKEFKIAFNGQVINCNLTWLYSTLNTASGTTVIKQCLEKEYKEDFTISLTAEVDKRWLIMSKSQSEAFDKKFPSKRTSIGYTNLYDEAIAYSNEHYGYDVVEIVTNRNELKFSPLEEFPYDPYNPDYEDIVIKISNDSKALPSTMPEAWKLQYNKNYTYNNYSYYKFINSNQVEYKYGDWDSEILSYTRNEDSITIEFGYPNKDDNCTIISNSKIHCTSAPYGDYEITN